MKKFSRKKISSKARMLLATGLSTGLTILLLCPVAAAYEPTHVDRPKKLEVKMELNCTQGECPTASFTRYLELVRADFVGNPTTQIPKTVVLALNFSRDYEYACNSLTCNYKASLSVPGSIPATDVVWEQCQSWVFPSGAELDDPNELLCLGGENTRSFWDDIRLLNRVGNWVLAINWLDVTVTYKSLSVPTGFERKTEYTIAGLPAGKTRTLGGGVNVERALYGWKARACGACNHLNDLDAVDVDGHDYPQCSMETADETIAGTIRLDACLDAIGSIPARWAREFIYDAGKSGSDRYGIETLSDTDDNTKYSESGDTNLCTETVTWYHTQYAESANTTDEENFYLQNYNDMDSWRDPILLYNDLPALNCYYPALDFWVGWKWTSDIDNGDWSEGNWYMSLLSPQPGDILTRYYHYEAYTDSEGNQVPAGESGHTMMVIATDDSGELVHVMSGPRNVIERLDLSTSSLAPSPVETDRTNRAWCISRAERALQALGL
ncbi:MAG: hypothetical protein JXR76_20100 [Deltaproteobacteria bacterium]|nr:hypothetical protein [Deltaproteobacteria bacterium]